MNPELREINDIIKSHVNTYNRRFKNYEIECNWKLMFDNGVSINVISNKVMYSIAVLNLNFEKYLTGRINRYEKQGLDSLIYQK